MIKQCTYLAACLAAAWAGGASAQEARFPGLRIEAVGGLDITGAKLAYEDTAFPADNFAVTEDTTGAVFGFGIGYDARIGQGTYVGIEGGYEWSDNERCEAVYGGDSACFSLKRNYFVGVRGGGRLSSAALAYGGIAYVNGKGEVSYSDPAAPADNFAFSDNRGGYRVSVGVEQRLGKNVYGKLEYRYTDYADYTYTSGTETATLSFDRNQVIAGVGVRF
ncbi:porin family protein [Altererythrobacter sp. FM1]|uniref:Porin family protein n=1 Tax=Tsuneonella flava TaxID=2055955 RepID=A0ABX7K8E5_9SPHN|nr:outer membrane beta-barrel protein [Tsuneonella flava]QSB43492.1 porin family protein [Tsuneonella flava]ROT94831.1 porin family protein [Altererythrobacter sp. FM1]